MNRVEYLSALDDSLKCMPEQERREALEFYHSYFEDARESGKTEEQIIAELGSVPKISTKIISQSNFESKSAASQEAFRQAGGKNPFFKGIKGVMLAIGAVIVSLPGAVIIGVPVLCVLFSLLIAAFCIVVALAALLISVFVLCMIAAVMLFIAIPVWGIAALGWGLIAIGIGLITGTLLYLACYGIIKAIIVLASSILRSFTNMRKRRAVA